MSSFFFFNDTATTEIYTLSLHDALPISPFSTDTVEPLRDACRHEARRRARGKRHTIGIKRITREREFEHRSEEHTSELQSRLHLVCRLLLEKKKKIGQDPAVVRVALDVS